jgi:hypothetical protein
MANSTFETDGYRDARASLPPSPPDYPMHAAEYQRGYAAARAQYCGSETKLEAEHCRNLQRKPWNWYVWQMNDDRWHISLLTNREA